MKKINREDRFVPPESTTGDAAHLLVKTVLSAVPGAAELFEYFIAPPLQKRKRKWMEEIAEVLRRLEKEQGVVLDTLQNDDRFITIMVQATNVAIRNHQKEKLTALKNVIVNSALDSDINEDLELIFIRFVEELTPTHLYLLKFFVDNEDELKPLKSYPEVYRLLVVKDTKSISQDEFKMLIGDLVARGLIWISSDIDDFEEIYQASAIVWDETRDDLPRIIVTDIAKKFLNYISYSLGA